MNLNIIDELNSIESDLETIGLLLCDMDYPNYNNIIIPENAKVFARTGMDGEMFCLIPIEKEHDDRKWPIYFIAPYDSDDNINIISDSFKDFINLIVTTGDVISLGNVSYMSKKRFVKSCRDIQDEMMEEQKDVINELKSKFNAEEFKNFESVYDYVRNLQAKTDYYQLDFPDDEYRPNE